MSILTGKKTERQVCETEIQVVAKESNQDDLQPFEDPQLLPQINTGASAGVRGLPYLFPKERGTSGTSDPTQVREREIAIKNLGLS
jgi:hypothetical protein